MATYRGIIRHSDLEGGLWELHADDGEVYQLDGGDSALRTEGLKVELDAELDEQSFGFAMRGSTLKITRYRAV
jgi:hypothetical protein